MKRITNIKCKFASCNDAITFVRAIRVMLNKYFDWNFYRNQFDNCDLTIAINDISDDDLRSILNHAPQFSKLSVSDHTI